MLINSIFFAELTREFISNFIYDEGIVAYAQGLDKPFGAGGGKVHGRILKLEFVLSRLKLRRHLDSLLTKLVHRSVDGITNTLRKKKEKKNTGSNDSCCCCPIFVGNLCFCSCSSGAIFKTLTPKI